MASSVYLSLECVLANRLRCRMQWELKHANFILVNIECWSNTSIYHIKAIKPNK